MALFLNIIGEWRIIYNDELYNMYPFETILQKIKVQKLRWLGYVYGMNPESQSRKGLLSRMAPDEEEWCRG